MGEIYCLYSVRDGYPRYIGKTEAFAKKRYRRHITNAIEMNQSPLYSWIRREWEESYLVDFYILQTNIAPQDLQLYEEYWINQFPDLLNVHMNKQIRERPTLIGQKVIEAIRNLIHDCLEA